MCLSISTKLEGLSTMEVREQEGTVLAHLMIACLGGSRSDAGGCAFKSFKASKNTSLKNFTNVGRSRRDKESEIFWWLRWSCAKQFSVNWGDQAEKFVQFEPLVWKEFNFVGMRDERKERNRFTVLLVYWQSKYGLWLMQMTPVQRNRRFHKENCALVKEIQSSLRGTCLHHFDAVVVILDSDTVSHQRFVKSTTMVLSFDATWKHTSVQFLDIRVLWVSSRHCIIAWGVRLRWRGPLLNHPPHTWSKKDPYLWQFNEFYQQVNYPAYWTHTWDWLVRHQLPIDSNSSFSMDSYYSAHIFLEAKENVGEEFPSVLVHVRFQNLWYFQ